VGSRQDLLTVCARGLFDRFNDFNAEGFNKGNVHKNAPVNDRVNK
jgi:hypothetical protein